MTLAIRNVEMGAQVSALVCVLAALANVKRLAAVVLVAQASAGAHVLIIAAAVAAAVVMAVAMVVLVLVRVVAKVPVQDVPLHALPIVATHAQMIALVIVA